VILSPAIWHIDETGVDHESMRFTSLSRRSNAPDSIATNCTPTPAGREGADDAEYANLPFQRRKKQLKPSAHWDGFFGHKQSTGNAEVLNAQCGASIIEFAGYPQSGGSGDALVFSSVEMGPRSHARNQQEQWNLS